MKLDENTPSNREGSKGQVTVLVDEEEVVEEKRLLATMEVMLSTSRAYIGKESSEEIDENEHVPTLDGVMELLEL